MLPMPFASKEVYTRQSSFFALSSASTCSSILFRKTHSSVLPLNLPPGGAENTQYASSIQLEKQPETSHRETWICVSFRSWPQLVYGCRHLPENRLWGLKAAERMSIKFKCHLHEGEKRVSPTEWCSVPSPSTQLVPMRWSC